jgi:flagellar M-ring protein FliF
MASLLDHFRNASPRRQAAVALAIAAGLALAFAGLYFAFLRRPYEVLYADLEAADAASIVAELDKESVSYRLADGGRSILVPQDRADATRLALAGSELASRGVIGFEVFNRSDMGLTEFAQRINYQRALQGELTRTIMAIDGVQSARVHLSISEPSVFRADRIPPKASVSLVAKGRRTITPELVAGVQNLVASAVPELDPQSVVVVDAAGAVVSPLPRSEVAESPVLQQTRAIEAYYAAAIRRALEDLAPDAQVEVSAALEGLDKDQALKAWTPQTRAFALRVTLTLPNEPDPALSEPIRAATTAALGAAENPDTISFEVSPSAGLAARERSSDAAPTLAAAARPAPQAAASSDWANKAENLLATTPLFVLIGLPVAGAVILLGAILTLYRLGRARRLSEHERERLARRFKTLLEGGVSVSQ